jgi:hypothetical protein
MGQTVSKSEVPAAPSKHASPAHMSPATSEADVDRHTAVFADAVAELFDD